MTGDVKARVAAFLAEAKAKHGDGHIAIVAHKAPQLALDPPVKPGDDRGQQDLGAGVRRGLAKSRRLAAGVEV